MNFLNNKLEEIIIKSSKTTVPSKVRSTQGYSPLKPKELVLVERYLKWSNRVNRLMKNQNVYRLLNTGQHPLWIKWLRNVSYIEAFLDFIPWT